MSKSLKPFRYSGNKSRLLELLPSLPQGTRRIVEPFAGSCVFSLNSELPWLGFEASHRIAEMWSWLHAVSKDEVMSLPEPEDGIDIRALGLPLGVQTYYQVNVCGAMTGQLSCWKTYAKKHRLPKTQTIRALPRIRQGQVIHDRASSYVYNEGDFVFIDPPYRGSFANYDRSTDFLDIQKEVYSVVCQVPKGRGIITYGETAFEDFPDLTWKVLDVLSVPNIRRGGVKTRLEMIHYV